MQLNIFDYNFNLLDKFDQDLLESILGINNNLNDFQTSMLTSFLSIFKFKKYKENGENLQISWAYSHTVLMEREICVVQTLNKTAINHEPGITFLNTVS